MKSKRKGAFRKRIIALVLAVLMVLVYIPVSSMIISAETTDPDIEGVYISALNSEYSGMEQNLVTASATTEDVIIEYSTDGNSWSGEVPTGKNVGEYDVYVKMSKEGFNTYESGKLIAKINKANQSFEFKNYSGSSTSVELNETELKNGMTYNFEAVDSEKLASGIITYSVDEDTMSDGVATIDETGQLKVYGLGSIVITAKLSGNENYKESVITHTLVVNAESTAKWIEFTNSEVNYILGNKSGIPSNELKKLNIGVRGNITYNISNGADLGLSIDSFGAISIDDYSKLIAAIEANDNLLNVTVNAEKEAYKSSFPSSVASYTLKIAMANAPELAYKLFLSSESEEEITSPTGNNGWYNKAMYVKPTEGYQIIRSDEITGNNPQFSSGITIGGIKDDRYLDQGKDIDKVVYLKNIETGEITSKVIINVDKIDSEAPTNLNISFPEAKNIEGIKYYKDLIAVTFSANDVTSGVDYFEWKYVREDGASTTNLEMLEGTAPATLDSKNASNNNYMGTLILPKTVVDQLRGHLQIKAVDKAGNESVSYRDEGIFVYDNISPTQSVEYGLVNGSGFQNYVEGKHYFNNNVKFVFNIVEANFVENDVKIYVSKNGGEVVSQNLTWENTDTIDGHKASLMLSDEGSYVITMNYTDRSGMAMKPFSSDTIIIDKTAPVIGNVEFSNPNSSFGGKDYYKNDVVARFKINEANFFGKDVQILFKDANGITKNVKASWTTEKPGVNVGTVVIEANENHSNDGEYGFIVSYKDRSDNTMNTYYSNTKVIDTTKPSVNISFNAEDRNVNGVSYYDGNIYGTIEVNEKYFDANGVVLSVTKDGANIPVEVKWNDNAGNVHIGSFILSSDGDYIVSVTYSDKAGNAVDQYVSNQKTIDTVITEPTITVNGQDADGRAFKDEVIPGVHFEDKNFDSCEVRLFRTSFADKNVDVTDKFISGHLAMTDVGGNGEFNSFDKIPENDGIYTMTVQLRDKVGHTSEKRAVFTVNRFGSVYEYDDYLASLVKDGGAYVKSVDKDLIITEYNADKLLNNSLNIEILKDSKPLGDTKYTTTPDINEAVGVGESGWYQYSYTISKDNFASDGVYKVAVSSKDATGNTPENNSFKDKNILFRVDSTPPEITSISGLENSIVNATEQNVKYTVYDTIGLDSVTVYVDDKEIDKITDFRSDENNYDGEFIVNQSSKAQKIRIVVADKAGNVTDTSSQDFSSAYDFNSVITVSTNIFVRFLANKPMFFGIVGGVAAAAVVVTVVLVRKKKLKNNINE